MSKTVTIKSDPVSDMLTRIRNAMMVNRPEIELPHSVLKEKVAKILVDYGFLAKSEKIAGEQWPVLKITINEPNMPAAITEISRVSRPGRRVYVKAAEIPTVKRGRGIAILSTSQGVMAAPEAMAKKLGGELICEVY